MNAVRACLSFRVFLIAVLAFALVAGPTASADPGDRRDAGPDRASLEELAAEAGASGSVRAIVTLRTDFEPEGRLHGQARSSQRAAIADERRGLYEDLHGTDHRPIRAYGTLPFAAVELSEEAVEALGRSKHVAAAVVDEARPPALGESSPLVEADLMWDAGFEGGGHLVAILDTGVDTSHPFLGGRVVEEACYSTTYAPHSATSLCPDGATSATGPGTGLNCSVTVSGCRHGTHVAGIAAGSGTTTHGVARGADIMSVQVFSRFDDCSPASSPCVMAYTSDIVAGLERVYAVRGSHDIAAANLSLGGETTSSACDDGPEKITIDQLSSANVATTISSGNDGLTDGVSYPACVSSAVAVGSTTKSDAVSFFSNGHPTLVDVLAPGSGITSSVPGGGFATFSGTSMAAPHVAGAWALIRDGHPDWSVSKVLGELAATGLPVTDTRPGAGYTLPRIRVHQASLPLSLPRSLSCGQVVTGQVVLTSNLVCSGNGLIVGSAGADIDLNGFVLRGQGSGNGVLVRAAAGVDTVTVRGGTIRGFVNGVRAAAKTVVLKDLKLVANARRGALILAEEGNVLRTVAVRNGRDGIFAKGGEGRIVVRGARAKRNGSSGFRLKASKVVVLNSVANRNHAHGVLAQSDRTVFRDSRARANRGHGLFSRAADSIARRNVVVYNDRLGIAFPNLSTVRGSNNSARHNNDGARQCRPNRIC